MQSLFTFIRRTASRFRSVAGPRELVVRRQAMLAFVALTVLTLTSLVWAQNPPSPTTAIPNATNFPMIGITRAQTLQLNLVAWPPDPCAAQLGFQDVNGNPLGASTSVILQPGQSTSVAINGNTLASSAGQRVQVLPTAVPTIVLSTVALPHNQCIASAEVIDNASAITTALIPGSASFSPVPTFGLLHVTELQTARLNVVAFPPDPCIGQLSFVRSDGTQVGDTLNVQLAPGEAASLDLAGSILVATRGHHAPVRPVVTAFSGGCVASAEVYLNGVGTTTSFWPPDPCSSSSASCTTF